MKTPKSISELKLVKLRQQETCFAHCQQNRSSAVISPWENLFDSVFDPILSKLDPNHHPMITLSLEH